MKFLKKVLAFFGGIYYAIQASFKWLIGQAVKTPPSHGGIRGSIPLRTVCVLHNNVTRLRVDISPLLIVCIGKMFQKQKGGEVMSQREIYESKTEELIQPILQRMGFELVDVEYVKEGQEYYLRAYIDKPGGITIDDCVAVSREMNELLDELDYISGTYTFEVSSPGLGRPLKKEKDYVRSMGKELEIRTYKAIDKQKEFYGTLTAFDADTVTIVTQEEKEIVFNKSDIALIRLAFDF